MKSILLHGDCIEKMEYLTDKGVKVDLILTDPPYGTTKCKWDNIISFKQMWECINGLSKERTPTLLFCDEPFASFLRTSNVKNYKYDWIWIKDSASNFFSAKHRPLKYHEKIGVFYKKAPKFYPDRIKIPRYSTRVQRGKDKKEYVNKTSDSGIYGKTKIIKDFSKYDGDYKNPSQHIYFPRLRGNSSENTSHPTQKPVRLLEHLIKAYTDEEDIVLDFTMGSGSTGVACKNLDRSFIGIEKDPEYFKIAMKRIKQEEV